MLTQQRLREVLSYCPVSGQFLRLNGPARWKGKPAGSRRKNSYVYILVDGVQHLAHRLAWLMVFGDWPKGHIDHVDGVRDNNAITNLRDVDRAGNMQNRRRPRKGSSAGLMGAAPHGKRFRSSIMAKGKRIHIGVFDTAEEAHEAYLQAKRIHHPTCSL